MKVWKIIILSCLGLLILPAVASMPLPDPEETPELSTSPDSTPTETESNIPTLAPKSVSDDHFYTSLKAGASFSYLDKVVHHGASGTFYSQQGTQIRPVLGFGVGHAFQQWTIPLRFELDYAFYQRTRFSIKTRDSGVDYNNRLSIVSQPVLLNMYYD